MRGLVVATCRLPHASVEELETARAQRNTSTDSQEDLPASLFTLTTCQRGLLAACEPEHPDPGALAAALARAIGVPGAERLVGYDALRHLTEVAASLDALVPGEDQVPGQFREAVREHVDRDLLEAPLHGTLQRVLAMARTVRAEAGFHGQTGRSLADLAAPLLPQGARVALVGTGQMARAAVASLGPEHVDHVVSADLDRARAFAPDRARAWERTSFEAKAPPVDALVLCTRAARTPVVGPSLVERLGATRGQAPGPLLVLDLGVPRNADPAVATLPGVDLRTIGELARVARGRLLEDPRTARARETLERVLQRERARLAKAQLSDRITELRDAIREEVDSLVEALAHDHPDLDPSELREHAHRTQGRLAHRCQAHLLQAFRGDPPG